MLSENTVVATRGLASTLTNSGLVLGVKPNTPLQVIMSEQSPMFVGRDITQVPQEDVEQELVSTAHTQMFGAAHHTASQKNFAALIGKQVEQSIRFARNEVNPLINEIIDSTQDMVERMRNNSALERPVRMLKLDSVYRNEFLLLQIKPHLAKRVQPSVIEGDFERRLMSVSAGQRLELMKTTSTSLNMALDALDKEKDFTSLIDGGLSARKVDNPYTSLDVLAKYLYLRGIQLGKSEIFGKDNLSTRERIAVANMVAFYANQIGNIITMADNHTSNKRIVLSHSEYGINVHEKNYLEWLRNGGSVEALLGYVATNSNDSSGLRNNPEGFVKRYEVAKRSASTKVSAEINGEIEQRTSEAITQYINTEVEEQHRPAAHAQLRAARKEFPFYGNMDIDNYVRYIVCKAIADDTDAYAYLNAMDEQFKIDPSMPRKEAAVMAAATLVVRYVTRQLEIEKQEGL